jgi:hypothetical protein
VSAQSSAHARLLRLQRRIYLSLEHEAERLLGRAPASIQAYRRAAERDFAGRHRHSTKEELVAAIRRHDVTFIADYHSFGQAQRTALRLMREAVLPGERWALGLELIPSHCQRALDDYQAGRIGTIRFHQLIRYREEWGFPWKNYEPLFAWARDHGVRCVALNRPRELVYRSFRGGPGSDPASGKDLHARDQWAAGVLTDLVAAAPGLRVIALYGGHHVGAAHLPAQLEKVSRAFMRRPLSSISVHQNFAPLYWKLARQSRELHSQVLRLRGGRAYCVFSATPWAQLQSLIGCAEGEDLEQAPGGGSLDYLSLMSAYGSVIAEFLGLPRAEAGRAFASLSLRTIEEADFVAGATQTARLGRGEASLAAALVAAGERFYLPADQLAYLASPSPNSAAEFAAIHLLRRQARVARFYAGTREDFYRRALESAFGFLGSLVLNPRRKCDLPADHARRIGWLARGRARPAFGGELEARQIALEILAGSSARRERALARLPQRPSARALCAWWASRAVGQVLAKRLYPRLLGLKHGSREFGEIVGWLTRRRDFEAAYARLEDRASSPLPSPARAHARVRRSMARAETSKRESI